MSERSPQRSGSEGSDDGNSRTSDENSTRHEDTAAGPPRCCPCRFRGRFCSAFSPEWMTPLIYNTFRYGLVLLYLGTLFMVIGYHNPWVSFVRYIGIGMVVMGIICVVSAIGQTCSRFARQQSRIQNESDVRGRSSAQDDNKEGLPSYETVVNEDLPSYSEAEALRLNPRFLAFKRHSAPANCYTLPTATTTITISEDIIQEDAEAEAREEAHRMESPPPTYSPSEVFHITVPPDSLFPIIPDLSETGDPQSHSLGVEAALPSSRRNSEIPVFSTQVSQTLSEQQAAAPVARTPNEIQLHSSPPAASRPSTRPPTRNRSNDFTEVNLRSSATRRLSASVIQPVSRPASVYVRTYSSSSFESESDDTRTSLSSRRSSSDSSCGWDSPIYFSQVSEDPKTTDNEEPASGDAAASRTERPENLNVTAMLPRSHRLPASSSSSMIHPGLEQRRSQDGRASVGELELEATHIEEDDSATEQNGNLVIPRVRAKTAAPGTSLFYPST